MSHHVKDYELARDSDDALSDEAFLQPGSTSVQKRRCYPNSWVLLLTLTSLSASVLSGIACFHWGRRVEKSDWFSPAGQINTIFQYEREYVLRPGNETQVLWDGLYPYGHGFFRHPDIAPEPRGFAVFHQLHCVDTFRHTYWALRDGSPPDGLTRRGHIPHCIDYLRQVIMCHADTNLELVNPYGLDRKCRDLSRVWEFANQWGTFDRPEPLKVVDEA